MKFSYFLLTALSLGLINTAQAKELTGISDARSIVRNQDGTYAVVCNDGSTETATAKQVAHGYVCNGNAPVPRLDNIEAIYSMGNGTYHVLCTDHTWQYATSTELELGNVCLGAQQEVLLNDGEYFDERPTRVLVENLESSKIRLSWPSPNDGANGVYSCDKIKMKCTHSEGKLTISIHSKDQFTFDYNGAGKPYTRRVN